MPHELPAIPAATTTNGPNRRPPTLTPTTVSPVTPPRGQAWDDPVCVPRWQARACPACIQGTIEFGVINQSQSAFSHILSDVSLVVYQFEALAGYSAVVDRLGQFRESVEAKGKIAPEGDAADFVMDPSSEIVSVDTAEGTPGATNPPPPPLLERVRGLLAFKVPVQLHKLAGNYALPVAAP